MYEQRPLELLEFSVDFLDLGADGQPDLEFEANLAHFGIHEPGLFDAVVCAECADNAAIARGSRVTASRGENPNFPNLVPTCGTCFAEWRSPR